MVRQRGRHAGILAGQRLQHGGSAGGQSFGPDRRYALLDMAANQLVGDLVMARLLRFPDQPVQDQLLEFRLEGERGLLRYGPQQLPVERDPEQGGGLERGGAGGRESGDPTRDQVADARGQGEPPLLGLQPPGPPVRRHEGALIRQCRDQLHDIEGVASSLPVEPDRELVPRLGRELQHRAEQQLHVGQRQRLKLETADTRTGGEHEARLASAGSGRGDQQHPGRQLLGDREQQAPAGRICLGKIVHEQHERRLACHGRECLVEPLGDRVRLGSGLGQSGKALADPRGQPGQHGEGRGGRAGESRDFGEHRRELRDDAELPRRGAVPSLSPRTHRTTRLALQSAKKLLAEPGLADTQLSLHHQQAAASLPGEAPRGIELRERRSATDQIGGEERRRPRAALGDDRRAALQQPTYPLQLR